MAPSLLWITTMLSRRPRLGLAVMLGIPLLLSGIAMPNFKQNNLSGWDVRSAESYAGQSSRQFDAFNEARQELAAVAAAAQASQNGRRLDAGGVPLRSKASLSFVIFFTGASADKNCNGGGSMLSKERLVYAADVIAMVTKDATWKEFCKLHNNSTSCVEPVFPVTSAQKNAANLESIALDGLKGFASWSAGSDFADTNSTTTEALRANFVLGLPLPGYANAGDRTKEQEDKLHKAMKTITSTTLNDIVYASDSAIAAAGVRVYYDYRWVTKDTADSLLGSDSAFSAGRYCSLTVQVIMQTILTQLFAFNKCDSVVFVGMFMFFHTRSAFIASCGLFQVLISFPSAYFFYRLVFNIEHFGTLQVLAIYVILGIGGVCVCVCVSVCVCVCRI